VEIINYIYLSKYIIMVTKLNPLIMSYDSSYFFSSCLSSFFTLARGAFSISVLTGGLNKSEIDNNDHIRTR
jgi:hypothetical protein